jgi:polyisoprenoid-binding protein YceI
MTTRPLALLCLLAFASTCGAADVVVAGKSEIAFTVKQMGVNLDGRFRGWRAAIDFRPDAPAQSKAEIDVDLASVDLASGESEAEAKGPLWFDTSKFPTAHFASTTVRSVGGDRYEVAGRLAMKGITRDFVIPLTVRSDAAGNRVADGAFSIKRLDYRIGEGEWADTAIVDNDIRIRFRIVLATRS